MCGRAREDGGRLAWAMKQVKRCFTFPFKVVPIGENGDDDDNNDNTNETSRLKVEE